MTSISAFDSSSIGVLFSSLSSNNSSSFGLGSNLGLNLSDYSLIKSGSYHKMLKAYFSIDNSTTNKSTTTTKNTDNSVTASSTSTAADSTTTLAGIESAASSLANSSADLYKTGTSSVFKTKKDESYDTDAIYKAVNSFVTDYNATISAAEKSKTTSIKNAVNSMENITKINTKALDAIGITINSDNTLSIDEETFKGADMDKVKSLFNGNTSYAYSVAVNASLIDSYAQRESSKANTYNSAGSYTSNNALGELYSSFF